MPAVKNLDKQVDSAEIFDLADAAGKAAAEAKEPVPMIVVQHQHPLDDNSPIVKVYEPVMGGVCGFAWINVPGNSVFGRYLKNEKRCSKGYPKGINYWVGGYGQSMEKKEAYAHAFAAVLREHGIKAYAQSRMD
jgi:hypothetical protein